MKSSSSASQNQILQPIAMARRTCGPALFIFLSGVAPVVAQPFASEADLQELRNQVTELRTQVAEDKRRMQQEYSTALQTLALNSVPVGTLMPFAGPATQANFPRGWLLCDGAELQRNDYPTLFAIIGTAWGSSNGNTFRIPDLRGRFLRGVDKSWNGQGSTGRDPELVGRTAAYPGGNTGTSTDPVGSVQESATKRPTNPFTTNNSGAHQHDYEQIQNTGGPPVASGIGWVGGLQVKTSEAGLHSHTVTSGGDNETRPKNAYVHYIIKAWYVEPNRTFSPAGGALGIERAVPLNLSVPPALIPAK